MYPSVLYLVVSRGDGERQTSTCIWILRASAACLELSTFNDFGKIVVPLSWVVCIGRAGGKRALRTFLRVQAKGFSDPKGEAILEVGGNVWDVPLSTLLLHAYPRSSTDLL